MTTRVMTVIDGFYEEFEELIRQAMEFELGRGDCSIGHLEDELVVSKLHVELKRGFGADREYMIYGGFFGRVNMSKNSEKNTDVHYDSNSPGKRLIGIGYLGKDPPCDTGTSFFRNKKLKIARVVGEKLGEAMSLNLARDGRDRNAWEEWKTVQNVYGRLLVFDASYFHAVTRNYQGRLVHHFRITVR